MSSAAESAAQSLKAAFSQRGAPLQPVKAVDVGSPHWNWQTVDYNEKTINIHRRSVPKKTKRGHRGRGNRKNTMREIHGHANSASKPLVKVPTWAEIAVRGIKCKKPVFKKAQGQFIGRKPQLHPKVPCIAGRRLFVLTEPRTYFGPQPTPEQTKRRRALIPQAPKVPSWLTRKWRDTRALNRPFSVKILQRMRHVPWWKVQKIHAESNVIRKLREKRTPDTLRFVSDRAQRAREAKAHALLSKVTHREHYMFPEWWRVGLGPVKGKKLPLKTIHTLLKRARRHGLPYVVKRHHASNIQKAYSAQQAKGVAAAASALESAYVQLEDDDIEELPDVLRISEQDLCDYVKAKLAGGGENAHATPKVIWNDQCSEVLVHVASLHVTCANGLVLFSVELETDETGRCSMVVPFCVGKSAKDQLVATTEMSVRGNSVLSARWGEGIQQVMWRAMLDCAESYALLAGGDMTVKSIWSMDGFLNVDFKPAALLVLSDASLKGIVGSLAQFQTPVLQFIRTFPSKTS